MLTNSVCVVWQGMSQTEGCEWVTNAPSNQDRFKQRSLWTQQIPGWYCWHCAERTVMPLLGNVFSTGYGNCSATSRSGEQSWATWEVQPWSSWISRVIWESQLNHWLCFLLGFFVKPPFYLEFRELTGTLVGLRGWSLRNVRIREIKWKNLIQTVPVLAWTCQLSPVSRAEAKGAAQALLGYGSSWAPSGMTVFIRTSPRAVESDVLSYALPWRIHGWGCLNMYWGTRL